MTGVQTCALPICELFPGLSPFSLPPPVLGITPPQLIYDPVPITAAGDLVDGEMTVSEVSEEEEEELQIRPPTRRSLKGQFDAEFDAEAR